MRKHKLKFSRVIVVYLLLAFVCLIVGGSSGNGASTFVFAAGEWLLALFCPMVLVYYFANGIFCIE